MALEGSLVLPIFLFFMMTVFLGLEAVRFQSNVLEALHQAGNAAAFEGDSEGYIGGGSPGAKARVQEYLDSQLYPYLCVSGGREGVTLQEFSQGSGQIELLATDFLLIHGLDIPVGKGKATGKKRFMCILQKQEAGITYHITVHI